MKITKKIGNLLVLVVLIAVGVWFYFTPQLAFREIRIAVRDRNIGQLESRVNFPALRASLKESAQNRLAEKLGQSGNPFGRVGVALAGTMLESLINHLVTPETLAYLLRGDRSRSVTPFSQPEATPATGAPRQAAGGDDKAEPETPLEKFKRYETFNRYAISVKKTDDPREPITFVLTREGLLDWKLSEIRNPF